MILVDIIICGLVRIYYPQNIFCRIFGLYVEVTNNRYQVFYVANLVMFPTTEGELGHERVENVRADK